MCRLLKFKACTYFFQLWDRHKYINLSFKIPQQSECSLTKESQEFTSQFKKKDRICNFEAGFIEKNIPLF